MSYSVLVADATKYGSTQEVAEAVAATLRERGLSIELQPTREVQSLVGCDAVVLGAPLYIGAWHRDALRFLSRQREALVERPVAIFALGPTHPDEQEVRGSREQLDKALAKFPWLTPVALEMFVGRYEPTKLRFPDSLSAKLPASPLHNAPASDERDWAAICAWASNLAATLQPAMAR